MNYNKTTLIGRLTQDPEVRTMPSGDPVVKITVATNNKFTTKDGEKRESVQFHTCVGFKRYGEVIAQYARKGQEVLVSGRLEHRTWDKKDGSKGYATEIVIEDFQLGTKAQGPVEVASPASEGGEQFKGRTTDDDKELSF